MSDQEARLARQVREALGKHNDAREAVVLLVRALVDRAAKLEAFAADVQGASEYSQWAECLKDVRELVDEHDIGALLRMPASSPPAPPQRQLQDLDEPLNLGGVIFKVTVQAPTPRS